MRSITADTHRTMGPMPEAPLFCIGAGRAGELLRKAASEQLEILYRECGFHYIRFHGLLSDDMGVYTEDEAGNPLLNFQYVDMVYDELLRIGIRPFVELSFTPAALASGEQTVFWWRTNVTPPRDTGKWKLLIGSLVRHWVERYGLEEVTGWYFEVWNEPNHPAFFTTRTEDYFPLYRDTVQAVKEVSPRLRVGGPATAGCGWVPELISWCVENHVPLDFISTHTYGVIGAFDAQGNKQLYLDEREDCIARDCARVREQIEASALPGLPLHFTEWSASYSARDPIHDSYMEASFILYQLKRCEKYVSSMSYWAFTDIFEEVGIPTTPFHGGFGLMNLQSLRKPAYYAYAFLRHMQGECLACDDEDAWVSREGDTVRVLLWSYRRPPQDVPNRPFFTRDIPAAAEEPVLIRLTGLPAGRYFLRVSEVGYGKNDVYGAYMARGYTDLARPQEVRQLQADCPGFSQGETETAVQTDGVFQTMLPRNAYDCQLLELRRG